MSVPQPYTPVTLDAVGESVLYDLRTVSESVVLTCAVTGTVTYVLEISNDERVTRSFITIGTYGVDIAKRLRAAMPRYLQVRHTVGAGSVAVSLGKALNQDGSLTEVSEDSRVQS